MRKLTLILLALTACTNESSSEHALRSAGFSEITFQGYDMFACSDSDTFATKFTAKNPSDVFVKGTVCCGWVKNCTIRY